MNETGTLDRWSEAAARRLARSHGRRSFLATVSRVLLGAAVLPLLPVSRAFGSEPPSGAPAAATPTDCEYWRYCAIDGMLCSCCGGSTTACPPGSEMGPITWVGTCRNPSDGKDYLISYNDCCGKTMCGRCSCTRNEGERPAYHWYRNNDVNWCAAGTKSQAYHCSVALVIGEATEPQPEQ